MNIIINNEVTEVKSVATSIGDISFTMEGVAVQDAVKQFSDATELSVANGDVVYGIYKNLVFASATVDAKGNVTVKFTIKSDIEVDIEELKQTQAEQDEILAEILYGVEEEVTINE